MANTYHCATDGSGDYTTIAQVNGATFSAGDSVLFRKGDTWNEKLIIPSSGSVGSYITFADYGSGNLPIMNGISITNKNYLNITNLESQWTATQKALGIYGCHDVVITGSKFNGMNISSLGQQLVIIQMSGGLWSYNITMRNCIVCDSAGYTGEWYGGGLCMNAGCHDILVENCQIYNNKETNTQAYSDLGSALWLYNITWRGNTIYNNLPFDPLYETGINFGWYVKNSIAENNYIYNCRVPIQTDSITQDNIIRNNIIKDGQDVLIRVMANSYGENNRTSVLNNTLIFGVGTLGGIWFVSSGGKTGSGHICKNNIIYCNSQWFPSILNTSSGGSDNMIINSDYNCFYNSDGGVNNFSYETYAPFLTFVQWQVLGQDSHSITLDPLLTSDYHLTSTSPCKDTGITLTGVIDDYEGNPRPMGASTDMGAYEYFKCKVRNATLRNCNL